MKTICAISTGKINAGIGVIRISGSEAFTIINKLLKIDITKKKSHSATYANMYYQNKLLDEVIIIKYDNPKSYTGEDLIEINCHGGVVIMNKIIETLISIGCTLAKPGEFSQRAFINGKIDLMKAESINDLIHAQTQTQTTIAASGFNTTAINELRETLLQLIATIEVNIDYPEYDDVEELTSRKILPTLVTLKEKLINSINKSKDIITVNEGIKVAIVGKPNAGKSSLLNALAGSDIAIVTDEAGTTRDVLKATISINGVPHTFIDTAGIRETKNKVEQIGVNRALEEIKKADYVINLIVEEKDKMEIDNKNIIIVQNKIDENKALKNVLTISAKNNDIKNIVNYFETKTKDINIDLGGEMFVANSRQFGLLQKSLDAVENGIKECENQNTTDIISLDLYDAIKAINEILGKEYKDGLLKEMFSKFCLGK